MSYHHLTWKSEMKHTDKRIMNKRYAYGAKSIVRPFDLPRSLLSPPVEDRASLADRGMHTVRGILSEDDVCVYSKLVHNRTWCKICSSKQASKQASKEEYLASGLVEPQPAACSCWFGVRGKSFSLCRTGHGDFQLS